VTTPIEPVGGRAGSQAHVLVVVAIVVVAIGLSVAKPWGGSATVEGGTTGATTGTPDTAASPSARPASSIPTATPSDPSSAFCMSPSGWRLTAEERFAGRPVREWQTIDPIAASGPLDRFIPVALVVSTSVTSLGWCAPASGPDRPVVPVTTKIWHVLEDGGAIRVAPAERSPAGDLGADYLPPGLEAPAADWAPGRYVFDVEGGDGNAHWFAAQVVRFVPDTVISSSPPRVVHPAEPPSSPLP
jgi:hypothetical protein